MDCQQRIVITNEKIIKVIRSTNQHEAVAVRLALANSTGNQKLPFAITQINQLNRANAGVNLTLSYAQVKHINDIVSNMRKKYHGGFIPLLALIPIIASPLGAAGGVAGGVTCAVSASNNVKAAAAAQAELEKNDREVKAELKA